MSMHTCVCTYTHTPCVAKQEDHVIHREEDDEYEDDDDVSWKVRRASAKCLAAILGSRPELLTSFYHTVSPVLIAQFKGILGNLTTVIDIIFSLYRARGERQGRYFCSIPSTAA